MEYEWKSTILLLNFACLITPFKYLDYAKIMGKLIVRSDELDNEKWNKWRNYAKWFTNFDDYGISYK